MANNSFLNIGVNNVNGYVINVERKVSAQQSSETSRIAARYFGSITFPNGYVSYLGENGKTAGQIKNLIGIVSTRESSEISKLKSAKKQLESLGLSTSEVDAKIAAAEQQTAVTAANRKELKKLQQVRTQLESLGLSTAEIDAKIEGLR